MGIRDFFLVILYLIGSASAKHEPKVYEELDEHLPEYTRTARHLDGSQKIYQPPIFNYRTAVQQDRLKSRYHRQQQSDSRNLKMAPVNHETIFGLHQYLRQNRGRSVNIPFGQKDNGWKPIQPKYLNPTKAVKPLPINPKKKLIDSAKQKDIVRGDIHENDLDIAASEPEQQTVKTDRQDQRSQYVYVTPSVLKNNFGLDSKTTQQILQNSAPENIETNSDKFQISELQELLGKNPSFQLQGLQKLLEQDKPIMENNLPISDIQIEHNGSPSLDTLQQQIDAINKAQEEQVLAAAEKEAEAHVKAQHEAIALAQKQAQEEALAKIAAHNQGISTLSPSDQLPDAEGVDHITAGPPITHHLQAAEESVSEVKPQATVEEVDENSLDLQHHAGDIEQPEVSALQGRPLDQILVHPVREYSGSYAPTAQDLRNVRPRIQGVRGRFYRPVSLTRPDIEAPKLQYLSAIPRPLYDPKDVQNYSPVSPYTPHVLSHNEIDASKIISEPTKPSLIHLPASQEHSQEYQQVLVEPSPTSSHQLYTEEQHTQYDDLHQYAAKYAFGYRILDEKHGNDFGHAEERDGKLTKGHYYVRLPDGRKQKVDYYADKTGYHARVSYENVGVHPYHQHPRQNEEHEDLLQPEHE